jgi:MFS family permease
MLNNYRAIFRNRAFSLFWFGFTFSVLGDALTRVALTWFVYESTHSALALGWLAFWYTGPILVGGLMAGWLLDRFGRRRVMLWDSLVRGFVVAAIPILSALGLLQVWHVYVVAALYGLLMMISLAGSPALIPALAPPALLSTANALETLGFTIGGILGPVLAGLLIGWLGAPNVVIIDCVSYFVFALALGLIRFPPESHEQSPHLEAHGLGDAFRLLLGNKMLLTTTFMYMAANIGGGGFISVWLPILSDQSLHGGPELFGLLLGAGAAGEVLSTLVVGGWTPRLRLGTLICTGQFLSGASLLLLLFSGNVWLVGGGLFLFGAFSAPLTIWAQTLRMAVIPERLRGRTFALLRTVMQGGSPLGGALAGVLLPLLGLPLIIALTAAVIFVPGLLGFGVEELRNS